MIWLNKHLVIMLVIRILVLPKNRSVLSADTGLTGVPDIQTGLTNTPTSLIGHADPDNPILKNSTSNNLEHDRADVVDWRKPIIEYLQDPSHKVDRKFSGLLSSLHW
jgi:hypothetical protein